MSGNGVASWRTVAVGAALVLAAAGAITATRPPGQPRLTVAGVAQEPCQPQRALPVPARLSGQFEPDSSIVRTAGGVYAAPGWAAPPTRAESACVAATERADLNWLRTGLVPGATATQRAMATRALLDLRMAVRPDGAALAGWHAGPGYEYAWPRDSSWVAVALTDTGHPALAYRILRFLQRVQAGDGTWAARYLPDGSGPVRDGRPAELDADGWVPWAVWSWAITQQLGPASQPRRELALLWPMVTRAADAAARSLTGDGLPGPAMDYWEDSVQVTLGTAAPLLAGLRAAADLAADVGGATATSDGRRWAAAAARLAKGIAVTFGQTGYQRTPAAGSGADAAVTFLGPPFAVPGPQLLRAAGSAQQALTVPNGGLRPGTNWPGTPDVAWTPETAFFALFDASTGQHGQASALLAWLAAHRTRLGSLPEQVNSAGQPASVAPLAWTDAVVLLALLAQAGHLPTIPVPPALSSSQQSGRGFAPIRRMPMDHETVLAYLDRVGVTGPAVGDAAGLRTLHRAHQLTVPFENLSIHLAEPISLDERDLIDKIVRRRRGGFCYELNGAFALLLEALGAQVSRVAARVHGEAGLSPPFDHLALIVRPADGSGPWLADVGFGSHSDYPLLVDARGDQDDPAGAFRLADVGAGDIDVLRDGRPQYRIETRERSLADCVPTCWWQQTSPLSHFTRSTICSRLTPGGRVSISGRMLIQTQGGTRAEQQLDTDDVLLAAYRDHFGIVLSRVPDDPAA